MQNTNTTSHLLESKASQVFGILLDLEATLAALRDLYYWADVQDRQDYSEYKDFFQAYEAERELSRRRLEDSSSQPQPGIPERIALPIPDDKILTGGVATEDVKISTRDGAQGFFYDGKDDDLPVGSPDLGRLIDLYKAYRELAMRTTPIDPGLLLRLGNIEARLTQRAVSFCAAVQAQESDRRPSASQALRVHGGMKKANQPRQDAIIGHYIEWYGDSLSGLEDDEDGLKGCYKTCKDEWIKLEREFKFPVIATFEKWIREHYRNRK